MKTTHFISKVFERVTDFERHLEKDWLASTPAKTKMMKLIEKKYCMMPQY